MEFKDKLRQLRKEKQITQIEAAELIGVSVRTYKNYELGNSLPRYREIYHKLGDLYGVNINYLLAEDEFLNKAGDIYGQRGYLQAKNLMIQMGALFSGGELSESDKDAVMRQMQEIYWDSKKENKSKKEGNDE
ncbi:MAG: helix-turn-helix transcriptional regulator [Tissierellia bacterium]|nr:helix-turn-helix transcriptional regulator [Tissierellia bacterium]